jgi:hypothetical protein
LSRNLKLRETIHRAGALEPLMKILSAKTDDEGALQVAVAQASASICDADA